MSNGKKQTPWQSWHNWAYIRGHFLAYEASKDQIDWLSVAEHLKYRFPPRVGHESKKGGKDYADQHVLKPLKEYIDGFKEYLLSMPYGEEVISDKQRVSLVFWKRKFNIA